MSFDVQTGTAAASNLLMAMQAGLTVRQIMSPRDRLMCCAPGDRLRRVTSNNTDRFSFIPVRENDRFLGLLCAEPWFDDDAPDDPVSTHFMPLGEGELIGADASIIDFVLKVAEQPCRLVVAGTRIEGLVSISDLQQLPVRAALFGLVTGLELAMAEAIRTHYRTADQWLARLSPCRRMKIEGEMGSSRAHEGFVDALLFTQFADKKKLLRDAAVTMRDVTGRQYDCELKRIQFLRDALAHANEYAATPERGRQVARTVGHIMKWHTNFTRMAGVEELVVPSPEVQT